MIGTAADVAGRRDVVDACDVVVVGSGAAGAAVARVLAEAGLDVVIVEEGAPFPPPEERPPDVFSGFATHWREMGSQMALGRAGMPVLQGKAVGGTTPVNGAIIHRIPPKILAGWQRDFGAGELLTEAELARVYDRLDAELRVAPAPADVRGRNNDLMAAGAEALGIASNPIARNVDGCRGSARCLQGCPNGAKLSMDETLIPRAMADGARVWAECRVTELITRGGRAAGVRGRFRDVESGRSGPRLTVRARRAVVVAASATQTPLLLRDWGLGRRSRLVGERFQAHPGTAVLGVFDDPVRMWFGATQGHESTHFWDERMKFESLALPLELAVARLPGFGVALAEQLVALDQVALWGVQVRAEACGTVRRWPRALGGGAAIRYDPTAADMRVTKLGIKRLTRMMFAAGARAVMPGVHGLPKRIETPDAIDAIDALPDDPRITHFIASHLFGTAVMGPDPRRAVVSPTGEAHELPGLFVADSSIFPTNLGVNPQHTISAVAWRVAERLAGF